MSARFYGDYGGSGQLQLGDPLEAAAFAGLPVKVDAKGVTDPACISKLYERRDSCAAAGEYRAALLLTDLLHVVEPRRAVSIEDCAPETVSTHPS